MRAHQKYFQKAYHAQMVGEDASSHKIDYVAKILYILSLIGHQNCFNRSKVMAILQYRLILPVAGVASEMISAQPTNQASMGIFVFPYCLSSTGLSHCLVNAIINSDIVNYICVCRRSLEGCSNY